MSPLALLAILLTLSALFGVLNDRTLRLPASIGVLVMSLLVSVAMLAIDPLLPGEPLRHLSQGLLARIDLPRSLLGGALSFLLFAGALQVELAHLRRRWVPVATLALFGTLLAVGLFGLGMWLVFPRLGLAVPLAWCIVLGAMVAPTDPVAVIGMLRRLGLPGPMQALFAGESLFNDGVGVVVFGAALGLATGDAASGGAVEVAGRFLVEAVGGGASGLVLGGLAILLMRATEDAHLELIVSLALATGSFSLADALHLSGPIAVVVAGLTLGTGRSRAATSDRGRHELTLAWSLLDEVLNAMLFLLIGFAVLAVSLHVATLAAALVAIVLSVAARALSVFLATLPAPLPRGERTGTLVLLTWGGLRGGISVALALGLPEGPLRAPLLTVVYAVVVFTIVVQGLTIERVARRLYPAASPG